MTREAKLIIATFAVVTPCVLGLAIYSEVSDRHAAKNVLPATSSKKPICDKSESMQARRRDAIDEMINKYHAFSKVEKPGDVVHVWASRGFYATKYDTKQAAMQVIYCYYYEATDDQNIIRIFDDSDGKQIGRYSVSLGLEME